MHRGVHNVTYFIANHSYFLSELIDHPDKYLVHFTGNICIQSRSHAGGGGGGPRTFCQEQFCNSFKTEEKLGGGRRNGNLLMFSSMI